MNYIQASYLNVGRVLKYLSLVLVVLGLNTNCAFADGKYERENQDNDRHKSYSIGLWGDLPYSAVQEAAIPALLKSMNDAKLTFTVHDGDLKAGSGSPCDEALYTKSLGYFSALKSPAMFTPGDNDWTDCDRPSNGGYNSRERMDRERVVFFSDSYSLGQHKLKQQVQNEALCIDVNGSSVACTENRRWVVNGVVYATLNVPGSCNNLCDTAPDQAEFQARNAANIVWLTETFDFANAKKAAAVMFISQANPGWDQSDPTRAPLRDPKTLKETDTSPDGYQDYLTVLRNEVIAFKKPVAYVHGDSHYFRVDKPFLDTLGRRLENFTRVETFGNNAANGTNDVQWLKVEVNPNSPEVFSYQPQIVPSNRVAVPAP